MKRLVALTLVTVMVLGVAATGYAAPSWKQGGGLPPGIQKKVTLSLFANLRDLDLVPWAKNAMEKMCVKGYIKGYNDNTFRPNKSVSQLEAVVMALRIMGWEEDALGTSKLISKYKGGKLDPWAYGYVNIAYQKGILDEVDLMYFSPNSAAKRWRWQRLRKGPRQGGRSRRPHGRETEIQGLYGNTGGAVGYIYVMNELGLMRATPTAPSTPTGP